MLPGTLHFCGMMPVFALYVAPLCPAGHLPHEGGDRLSFASSQILNLVEEAEAPKRLISPLVGEMAGRPEGGAKE